MTDKPMIRDIYEARLCPGILPTDCCDYGVISRATGKEVCRVLQEDDARLIANLMNESRESAVAELQAEVDRLRKILARNREGWLNLIEIGILPDQYHKNVKALADANDINALAQKEPVE